MPRTGDLQDSWRSPVHNRGKKQETWNVGAGSGYKRDRQARWDAREMRTATTKVRRDVYEEFRRLCQEQGETPYSVLQGLLLDFMARTGQEVQEQRPWTGWHSSGGGT